jgi:hypothetical protein
MPSIFSEQIAGDFIVKKIKTCKKIRNAGPQK